MLTLYTLKAWCYSMFCTFAALYTIELIDTQLEHYESLLGLFFFSLYALQNTKNGIEDFYSSTGVCGNQFK